MGLYDQPLSSFAGNQASFAAMLPYFMQWMRQYAPQTIPIVDVPAGPNNWFNGPMGVGRPVSGQQPVSGLAGLGAGLVGQAISGGNRPAGTGLSGLAGVGAGLVGQAIRGQTSPYATLTADYLKAAQRPDVTQASDAYAGGTMPVQDAAYWNKQISSFAPGGTLADAWVAMEQERLLQAERQRQHEALMLASNQ